MKRIITVFLLLLAVSVTAQEYKFGDVSKEELEEKECSLEPDANAAILYKHRESYIFSTNDNVQLITERYKKIKIYSKDGFSYATENIHLYRDGSTREQVRKIKAVTYNLENGKIEEYKLGKDQIFETNVSEYHTEIKFTLPNVKEGSVIEIQYEVISPYYWDFDDVNYQYYIPVKKFYAEIRTPEIFHYKQTMRGFEDLNINQYKKTDHRVGAEVEVYEYSKENIPSLKREPLVDNMDNYRGSIVFELAYIQTSTKFQSYAQTWEDVAKKIADNDDYKQELDKARFVNDIVDPLVAGVTDPLEKTRKLFNYVKDNYTWNESNGKYFDNGLRKTIKEKKGNTADINLLLVAMLRYAGVDANPVVISTKDNMVPMFPTLDGLNYVIAHAQIGDEEYLMDATREFSEINVLPMNDYNWEGIYINNNTSDWKKIPLRQPDQGYEGVDLMCKLSEDGSAEGQMRYTYDKHDAMFFRTSFKNKGDEDYIKAKEGKLNGIEISNFKAVNTEASDKRAVESFSFYMDEASEVIGGKLYMNPLMFLGLEESPFKAEKRNYPIDFYYPFENKYNIIITIPQGYQVEFAPQSKMLKLPENLGEVKYLISKTPAGLQISYDFKINQAFISPVYYEQLKGFFSKMVEIESEKIILSKV